MRDSGVRGIDRVDPFKDFHHGLLERTRRTAADLGVADRVSFPGGIPQADVPAWLDSSDIFLNTTDINNTPVSVMEAMAAGLCVVSTDVGGIPFLLSDGEDALLVPAGDAAAMASAVRRLIGDERFSTQLSAVARQRAEGWDWSVVLPLWTGLLGAVSSGQRQPASASAVPAGAPEPPHERRDETRLDVP